MESFDGPPEADDRRPPPIGFAKGVYTLGGPRGEVFFSSDARTWRTVPTGTERKIKSVQFDGERWVVANWGKEIALSAEGKTWSSFFASAAGEPGATVWHGKYWTRQTILGVPSGFVRGRYDGMKDERLVDWDGQLTVNDAPLTVWSSGDRLHLLLESGRGLTSDNGEYWQIASSFPTGDTEAVYFAEGNNRAVTLVVTAGRRKLPDPVVLSVAEENAFPRLVDVPFKHVHGLAFGLGRFVALAATTSNGDRMLYESRDGLEWRQVATFDRVPVGLVYGPAGFVVNLHGSKLAIYRPTAWPEERMAPPAPTPIPDFRFTDLSGRMGRYEEGELRAKGVRAANGEVAARVDMAFLMTEAKWAYSNPWRAELWFKAGIEAGVASAGRGYAQLLAQWKPETSHAELADLYRKSAEKGDKTAVEWLALTLEEGRNHDRTEIERWRDVALAADPQFAARWAKREVLDANTEAAFAGDYAAIEQVLPILVDGDILAPEWDSALILADFAAQAGRHEPAAYLARLYQNKYDFIRAKSVFAKADYQRLVDRGAAAGFKPLFGQRLENMMGGRFGYAQDERRALALARQLADTGDADGMFMVAMILAGSRGEQKDEAAAKEWMRKAATAGNAQAQSWAKQQDASKPAAP